MLLFGDIEGDARFRRGLELFNSGDFFEASEEFEELFFEAVREEIDFVRVFLQISVGAHHVERGQIRAAIERLQDGVTAVGKVIEDRGFDLQRLGHEVETIIPLLEERLRGERPKIEWPKVFRRDASG